MSDLIALKQRIEDRESAVRQEIESQHHTNFIQQVGLDILMAIPVVGKETLGLDRAEKYPTWITPDMLGEKSAVRGLDVSSRPFIAIKVDFLDPQTEEKITQLVELIFKRYSLKLDGANDRSSGNNYVTSITCLGSDGKMYNSGLYSSYGMPEEQRVNIGRLLRGETVRHKDGKYLMRMSLSSSKAV